MKTIRFLQAITFPPIRNEETIRLCFLLRTRTQHSFICAAFQVFLHSSHIQVITKESERHRPYVGGTPLRPNDKTISHMRLPSSTVEAQESTSHIVISHVPSFSTTWSHVFQKHRLFHTIRLLETKTTEI
jgi:hypothetical protein